MFQKFCFCVSCYLQTTFLNIQPSLFQQGVARIHVIDAQKLSDEDSFFFGGESDPFVIVTGAKKYPVEEKAISNQQL